MTGERLMITVTREMIRAGRSGTDETNMLRELRTNLQMQMRRVERQLQELTDAAQALEVYPDYFSD